MEIKVFVTGMLYTNAYLLVEGKEAVLIDSGGDPSKILSYIDENDLDLKYILLTHGHGDHIFGLNKIRSETGAKIGVHAKDVIALSHAFNLSITNAEVVKEDFQIKQGEILKLGELKIKVIETPGHTPGGVCFYLKDQKIMFTGDTLFKTGVGRDDLPGGSWGRLKTSLEKLVSMDEDIRIFPGHGDNSTIGAEKAFLKRSGIISH